MYLSPGWPEEEDRKIGGQELELGDQGTIHSGEKKKNSFAFVRIYQSNVFNFYATDQLLKIFQ